MRMHSCSRAISLISHITPLLYMSPNVPPPSSIYANELGPSSLKLLACLLCLSIRQHLQSAEADGNAAVRESCKQSSLLLRLISRARGEKLLALSQPDSLLLLFTRHCGNLIQPNNPLMQGETEKPGKINTFH